MLRIILTLALLGGLLAGCGQSGPLYLPGDPSAVTTAPPQQGPETEDDAEKPEG